MACARNYCGPPVTGGKHRQEVADGRRERRPGGKSLRDQAIEGGEKRVKRERENQR